MNVISADDIKAGVRLVNVIWGRVDGRNKPLDDAVSELRRWVQSLCDHELSVKGDEQGEWFCIDCGAEVGKPGGGSKT